MRVNISNTCAALVVSVLLISCGHHPAPGETAAPVILNADSIPALRNKVNPNPIAMHTEPVNDPLNHWKFAVSVYETGRTFHYTVRMQYKELRVSDSLNIPDFGIPPHVEIRRGGEPLSCIIGFLDKKGRFREYKKAIVKGKQLRFTTIANYAVGVYKTRKQM